jgi:hypothetical protein
MDWGSHVRFDVFLAVAGLAATPIASAQEASRCDTYNKIIAEAASGFEAFKGEAVPGRSTLFMSTYSLNGFRCMIGDGPDKMFICYTGTPTKDVAELSYTFETAAIQRCFPDWASRPPASIELAGDPITEAGIQFYSKVDDGEISIGAIRAHLDVPEPAPRILGIAVMWRPVRVGA